MSQLFVMRPLGRSIFIVSSSIAAAALLLAACGSPPAAKHGSISSMSVASSHDWKACEHQVPEEVCVRCKPERAAKYKAKGDWCKEHDVPESQCLTCNPDLDFSPPKAPPAQADIASIAQEGDTLAALEPHLVAGKVTVFDFHATWCPPCRKVDEHLYPVLAERNDIALRKIDIGTWETLIAEQWLSQVPELPYLVVYDKKGKKVGAISGADLAEIDRTIAKASQ